MWIVIFLVTMAHAWTDPAETKSWMVVNDTVMGGVSEAEVKPHPDGGVMPVVAFTSAAIGLPSPKIRCAAGHVHPLRRLFLAS